jgi:hypothetical protein
MTRVLLLKCAYKKKKKCESTISSEADHQRITCNVSIAHGITISILTNSIKQAAFLKHKCLQIANLQTSWQTESHFLHVYSWKFILAIVKEEVKCNQVKLQTTYKFMSRQARNN